MSISIHREGVVGPDGTIEVSVPELQPGQRVSLTIEVFDTATAHQAGQDLSSTPRHYTATELMRLPREERDRILEAAAAAAAEDYATNPELSEFEAFGEGDLYDDHPSDHPK